MAKKDKKTNQTGLALACWILGFLILLIVFLVKQDDIYSNLKTTRFFERLFGTTPQFIEKHEIKEKPAPEEETIITLKTDSNKSTAPSKENFLPKTSDSANSSVSASEAKKTTETKNSTKTEQLKNTLPEQEKSSLTKTKEQSANSTKTENSATATTATTKSVTSTAFTNQKLYFVYIGDDGVVSRKVITRSVEKNDSPLFTNLNLLLEGPNQAELSKGYKTLIPSGTRLLAASVRDGVAYLNFSEEFEYNRIGVDGYVAQLNQIIYTATEFPTVSSVQFLIDGQKKLYLGSEGVWIGTPLTRDSY